MYANKCIFFDKMVYNIYRVKVEFYSQKGGYYMTKKEAWDLFSKTGKISDYLVYVNLKGRAREKQFFIIVFHVIMFFMK